MENKIAVVTGANGGIGKELIVELEKSGIRCICIDKENTENQDSLACDFSKEEELYKLVKIITSKFHKIDFLFNVAGIGIYKPIEDLSSAEWNNSLTVNLTAPFILSKELLPLLNRASDPLIVNFGSGMGLTPSPGRIAYCSSKFGLRGLSLSLSKEFENKNVHVVLLTLGSVMTNFGTGGIEHRKRLAENGKKYLTPSDVVKKVFEIINSSKKKPEYFIYPQGYLSKSESPKFLKFSLGNMLAKFKIYK